MSQQRIPAWINYAVIPVLNVLAAFLVSALVFIYIGVSPIDAAKVMWQGAFGYSEGWGYTLYYTTGFIFTGLAVAVAFSAQLFNIGGEGQAYLGGLGVTFVSLWFGNALPAIIMIPLVIIAAGVFGAGWAYIPAYLQAKRGSHIVITTIMFNLISNSLIGYILLQVLKPAASMASESAILPESSWIPRMHEVLSVVGIDVTPTPWNLSFVFALLCCVFVWLFLWHTRWGYEIRAYGANASASAYAGVSSVKIVLLAMILSGMLSGFFALNMISGDVHQLKLNYVAGFGFTGIAVALMGRNHPVGIVLASLLFGFLYQGGAELAFEFPGVDSKIIVVLQGLIILFSGALEYMFKPSVEKLYLSLTRSRSNNDEEAQNA
ncbi:ABC transporter permease [Gynuella sunshinyii]|uniref:ABC-type uncharacterized transport system, permease component n=1 Tax=Gynuella sunshinyii YC6258 TaxID=1445510 RepID=A0A0C5VEL4_9GAMM|nr:ABC transporter permease [Gynuella sunshinyii]AJQ97710.1 ABC-type uncharacterized transport system, permease component [Gynuella sunshinyii YC6258]